MKTPVFSLFLFISALLPAPSAQEALAVKAGTLVLAPGKVIPGGTLLVREGKVFAARRDLTVPAGARELNLPGRFVAPGLVDCWSRASVAGEVREDSSAWTPGLKAADALDLEDPAWEAFAREGITSVVVTPDPAQVGGGLACLVKTGSKGRLVEDSLFLQFSFTANARNRERPPTSLAGQVALVRDGFRKAGNKGVLARAMAGKLPVVFACGTPAEVQAALRLAAEFRLPKVLLAAPPSCRPLASILEGAGAGLFLGPPSMEAPAWSLALPAELFRRNVSFAFYSGYPSRPPADLRLLPALAARHGLPPRKALEAVTEAPARLLDLSWRVGSLRLGRDADFIVLDGPPLDPGSRVLSVYVEGKPAWTPRPGLEKENRK